MDSRLIKLSEIRDYLGVNKRREEIQSQKPKC